MNPQVVIKHIADSALTLFVLMLIIAWIDLEYVRGLAVTPYESHAYGLVIFTCGILTLVTRLAHIAFFKQARTMYEFGLVMMIIAPFLLVLFLIDDYKDKLIGYSFTKLILVSSLLLTIISFLIGIFYMDNFLSIIMSDTKAHLLFMIILVSSGIALLFYFLNFLQTKNI